jgi:Stress responsive A/B Barrel Domain
MRPFSHVTYFQLTDTSKELIDSFIDLCVKHLSGYPGQTYFTIGYRALDINRDVSATNFEVSMTMVFADFTAYNKYSTDPKHDAFVIQSAGMSFSRIVYDSFLEKIVKA